MTDDQRHAFMAEYKELHPTAEDAEGYDRERPATTLN
jgi:hypothetical protein